MNCPKCGQILEQGSLVGFHLNRSVYWMPKGVKGAPHGLPSDKERLERKGGYLILTNHSVFTEPRLMSWYCPKCRCGVFEAEPLETEI